MSGDIRSKAKPKRRRPKADVTSRHAEAMAQELRWLRSVVDARLTSYFEGRPARRAPKPPVLSSGSAYRETVDGNDLSVDERLTLALALAPHAAPEILDPFLVRNGSLDRPFTEFGGRSDARIGGFFPTGQTAAFLIAGADPAGRVDAMRLFAPDHRLRKAGLLDLDRAADGGSWMTGRLVMPSETIAWLCTGEIERPDFSAEFPARRISTPLDWHDLVLPADVKDQIDHISGWLAHEERILDAWGLRRRLAPGYRALFHGPPGTGKTLTAALLGKRQGLDVYRIDLSMVVSKYVGETEKNLAGVFDRAAHRNWILFFDEADALFGSRTSTTSAHDRYANQEVAYLLQRIEDSPGLTILATNLRGNIDDAFARRFQSVIGFRRPDASERLRLWRDALSNGAPLDVDVDLAELAERHEIAGGAIANAIRHAAISSLRRGHGAMSMQDLQGGVASELRKEGRTP